MFLGYNTNGLAHHDPLQAIELIAELGYRGLAITVDHRWLNPFAADFDHQIERVQRLLKLYRIRTVVETGARFLLDPASKHEPTLVSDGATARGRRIDFLKRCIDIAEALGSDCVSLWSGVRPASLEMQEALDRLAASLEPVVRYADNCKVILGFEPEPGMLIDTMASFERMLQWIDSPVIQLTMDVGHLFCQGEVPFVEYIQRWSSRIVNVHIEDMRAGVHEHLMFGDGQIHFPPIIEALHEAAYGGGVFVELSRHGHDAPNIARRSLEFLGPLIAFDAPRESKRRLP